jgi:hypothetical protein
LLEGAKFSLQQQGARLVLPKELILKVEPGGMSGGILNHQRLLEVIRHGAVDPRESMVTQAKRSG